MFPLFPEKLEVRPKNFSCKKTIQTCNPPDFKFYPRKLTNKNFPQMV